MDELKDLQEFLRDGRKAMIRLGNWMHEFNAKYNVPIDISLDDIIDRFKYLRGYVDCLVASRQEGRNDC